MLQPSDKFKTQNFANPISNGSINTVSSSIEQATIGRSLVIKGEVSGSESIYIDGRVEGSINFADHRVTIGRHGVVNANVTAREVVIMGKVNGNVECTDRVDIRSEGSLVGDVITQRVSVEDGALVKGAVEVRASDKKNDKSKEIKVEAPKAVTPEAPKALAATAGAGH
ncbi:MAG TPA: polymer-forming cytoskeletal protein [Terriglobales bacterium]|jgi:cytoskeletal protein CcmA (bactofilin family)